MGVTIRKRTSQKGIVYWLDISNAGHRSRRTLKIDFSLPEKQRLSLAQIAAAQEQKAIMTDTIGITPKKSRNFISIFENYVASLPRGNNRKYANTLRHMRLQYGNTVMTNQVTKQWLEGWKKYLISRFNGETPATMWRCTKRIVNLSIEYGFIKGNPAAGIKRPDIPDTISKEVLSASELATLVRTPFPDEIVCRAFLWCCYTGMARPEILSLTWSAIDFSRMQVKYKRTKTGKMVIVDLSETALQWLPEKNKWNTEFNIFIQLPSDSHCHKVINRWMKSAGIQKKISWYGARHTFAVLLLEGGADLLTVSKLLGHTTTEFTVRYLKLIDHLRRSAVDRLPVLKR